MRFRKWLSIVVVPTALLFIGGLAAPAAVAATGVQRQIIPSPIDAAGNRFGFAAALNDDNGTVALVGAPGTNPPTPLNTGKALVFTHQGAMWPEQQELVPNTSPP